jgi:histidine phosphotransferase ChpT
MDAQLRLARLLSSRLCHDLLNPLGAVNTGLELLTEQMAAAEGLDLVRKSADTLTRRLECFRFALGAGNAGGADGDAFARVRTLAAALFAGGKVALQWGTADPAGGPEAAKLTLNLVLLASEALPRGGQVAVRTRAMADGLGIAVTARGAGAKLRPDIAAALASGADLAAATARTAQAYFTARLAAGLGAAIEVDPAPAPDLNPTDPAEVRLATLVPLPERGGT